MLLSRKGIYAMNSHCQFPVHGSVGSGDAGGGAHRTCPDASCQKIVVHLSGWASADQAATLALDPHQRNRQDIKLEPAENRQN